MFLSIGEAWTQIALAFATTPTPRILDAGCGCGKMARFFYLNPGAHYRGFDAYRPSIDWCRTAFKRAGDRFHFEHLDVRAFRYNEDGLIDPAQATFPAGDASIDILLAASLFTHLAEQPFRRYMNEIGRCLRPGGRALVSIHAEPRHDRFEDGGERVDIATSFFLEIVTDAGLSVVADVGNVFGQRLFVLSPAN
jgi:SAM-dependent methyltransferase